MSANNKCEAIWMPDAHYRGFEVYVCQLEAGHAGSHLAKMKQGTMSWKDFTREEKPCPEQPKEMR